MHAELQWIERYRKKHQLTWVALGEQTRAAGVHVSYSTLHHHIIDAPAQPLSERTIERLRTFRQLMTPRRKSRAQHAAAKAADTATAR